MKLPISNKFHLDRHCTSSFIGIVAFCDHRFKFVKSSNIIWYTMNVNNRVDFMTVLCVIGFTKLIVIVTVSAYQNETEQTEQTVGLP